jgi:general secretion pathway protein J
LVQALRSWQIYYHRDGAWSNALSSSGANPTGTPLGANNVLPEGIRLVIELPDNAALSGKVTLDWVRPSFTVAKQ